jgi:hypothetical protein
VHRTCPVLAWSTSHNWSLLGFARARWLKYTIQSGGQGGQQLFSGANDRPHHLANGQKRSPDSPVPTQKGWRPINRSCNRSDQSVRCVPDCPVTYREKEIRSFQTKEERLLAPWVGRPYPSIEFELHICAFLFLIASFKERVARSIHRVCRIMCSILYVLMFFIRFCLHARFLSSPLNLEESLIS